MIRIALYARYSSDQQSAASIEDQLRICRERASREGWHVVQTYQDAASRVRACSCVRASSPSYKAGSSQTKCPW